MLDKRSLKLLSLVILSVQTSAFVLVARQSRKPDSQGHVYFAGTAVFLMELTKLLLSTLAITIRTAKEVLTQDKQQNESYQSLNQNEDAEIDIQEIGFAIKFERFARSIKELIWTWDAVWLLIPAASYVAQNNLQLMAASYLEPALFQTFTQAKLITTAIFSVLMLKRTLHHFQWAAIIVLAVGLAIVQATAQEPEKSIRKKPNDFGEQHVTLGFVLMMGASLLSGFAGVFMEKILKKDRDFWATNFHMSFFSLFPSIFLLCIARIKSEDFHLTQSFGGWAWATVLLNAVGGLIVSMVLKYADSIAKGFSLASAVIITVAINVIFFKYTFTFACLFGIMTVLLATTLYIYASQIKTISAKENAVDQEYTDLECETLLSKEEEAEGKGTDEHSIDPKG